MEDEDVVNDEEQKVTVYVEEENTAGSEAVASPIITEIETGPIGSVAAENKALVLSEIESGPISSEKLVVAEVADN